MRPRTDGLNSVKSEQIFFLAERFLGKFVVKATLKIPPHLATLPCETLTPAQQYLQGTHTHPFNGPFSRTTRVSRYQKGNTNLDFAEARDGEWQWHQLGHMQVCT